MVERQGSMALLKERAPFDPLLDKGRTLRASALVVGVVECTGEKGSMVFGKVGEGEVGINVVLQSIAYGRPARSCN